VECNEQATLRCFIFDDVYKKTFEFESKFKFLDNWHIKRYDMIIGLQDIIKYDILSKMASRLGMVINDLGNGSVSCTRRNFPCEGNRSHPNQKVSDTSLDKEMLTALEFDGENFAFIEPTWDLGEPGEQATELSLPQIYGSPELQRQLHALVLEFSDIWAESLDSQPAELLQWS
jgi:hypothetical protein